MGKEPSFESAIKKLEQIVLDLETGDPSLEKALDKFEKGIELAKFCSKKLDETEKRVTLLVKDRNGALKTQPFPNDLDES